MKKKIFAIDQDARTETAQFLKRNKVLFLYEEEFMKEVLFQKRGFPHLTCDLGKFVDLFRDNELLNDLEEYENEFLDRNTNFCIICRIPRDGITVIHPGCVANALSIIINESTKTSI